MKNFVVILFIFVNYIDLIDSTNTTQLTSIIFKQQSSQSTSTRPAPMYCYNCAYCPFPFDPNHKDVQQVYSPFRWCVKMNSTDSPGTKYNRGPDPGYCSSDGCSWKTTFGIKQWVCCCNKNLCNMALSTSKPSIVIVLLFSIIFLLTSKII